MTPDPTPNEPAPTLPIPGSGEQAPTVDSTSAVASEPSSLPTAAAPSFRPPVGNAAPGGGPISLFLGPGDRIDDFEIIASLGAGAFATVYLARQVSLDRQVALKVSANRGSEARTLASLEHEHIIRVFSEVVHLERNQRLLCMQYVNGTTLHDVIRALNGQPRATWSGRAFLEALDKLATRPSQFDPAALRDRELLERSDYVEAVCWLGARLAEALAHAHSQGVLHRDIKPANILLNRYGRPFLADFNMAFDPRPRDGRVGRDTFGGTLGYMAPEHIDAFNPAEETPPEAVDQRSDVYSLGVVIYEMLAGGLPFGMPKNSANTGEMLRQLAKGRREGPPTLPKDGTVAPEIERIVSRCLAPNPFDRYQTAADLAHVLEGCREQLQIEKQLPKPGPITRAAVRHPFRVGMLLVLLPHLLGSIVNISYNSLRIVEQLTDAQQATFARLVLYYNLAVYPPCILLMIALVRPIWRAWQRFTAGDRFTTEEAAQARRRVLRLPLWAVALSCAGWLPGGLVFPLALWALSPPLAEGVFGHFGVSFTISGLIALTYSVYGVQFVVLRVIYPRLWIDGVDVRQQAREELAALPGLLQGLQLLAGAIPLIGAVMMVGVGPEEFRTGYQSFRLLVTALIGLGMLGFGVAVRITALLGQTLVALTTGERRSSERSVRI